jgi:hypothetical protein
MKKHEPEKFAELYKWKDLTKTWTRNAKWMIYDDRIKAHLINKCGILKLVDGLDGDDIQSLLVVIDACSIIMDDRVAFRETESELTFHW